jgi:hypothetical protein
MKTSHLTTLAAFFRLDCKGHIEATKEISLEEWIERGCPHHWLLVELTNDIYVYMDMGHGFMAAFKDDILMGATKSGLIRGLDCIILDKVSRSVSKYVWQ